MEPIEDRDSYLLRELHPTGTARGWRRTGCIALLWGAVIAGVATLVAILAFGSNDDGGAEPCDELQIRLTYLEGFEATSPDLAAEAERVRADLAELGC